MDMNPDLQKLEPYPFAKLQELFRGLTPPADKTPIALSIGEPQHESPAFVLQVMQDNGLNLVETSPGELETFYGLVDQTRAELVGTAFSHQAHEQITQLLKSLRATADAEYP